MSRRRSFIPPDPIRPATSARFYCPRCGMVRPAEGVQRSPGESGDTLHTVRRHHVYRPGPWPKNAQLPVGESLARKVCPGGVIDPKEDRAP